MGFADEKYRQWSKQDFVDNETGSDEYAETQPGATLELLGKVAPLCETMSVQGRRELLELVENWVEAALSDWSPGRSMGYAGCEEAMPLFERIHDLLWDANQHPYYSEPDELIELIEELDEGQHAS